MERMQQQPVAAAPGRRGVSPASVTSSSSSKPSLLHRRRDSSLPRQTGDDWRTSNARNLSSLPPLTISTQQKERINISEDRLSKQLELKKAPREQQRKADRDTLPSVIKAATTHESVPSNLKMVSFASDEEDHSDDSSICHSPTWDDYGRKKRKGAEEKRKGTEEKRKRLSKHPPPTAMENRPKLNSRALSDPILTNYPKRPIVENTQSSSRLDSMVPAELPVPSQLNNVESAEKAARSPGFIGGVRLEREREREREAAMTRLTRTSRPPSEERTAAELSTGAEKHTQQQTQADLAKKRETAPTTFYPPTSSKTPMLKQSGNNTRTRRGSFGSGIISAAGKLFGSKEKENGSQESGEADQASSSSGSQDRGRQMGGNPFTHGRGQSYDSHERYASQKGERRGAISLPPVSWKNKRGARTASMVAVPPDSARDGSFSPHHSPKTGQGSFGFLEQPFSPPADGPPSSPFGSLSASMKAKMNPAPTLLKAATSPAWQPGKRKLKDAIRSGLRSGATTPDATPTVRRRSGTMDTLAGAEIEIPLPGKAHPPQSSTSAANSAKNSPALSAKGARQSHERRVVSTLSQNHSAADAKDSGASSASSHPDSESQPPSPVTTPDTSRPQSSKDNQAFRVEDVRKSSTTSQQGNVPTPIAGPPALGEQASEYFSSKQVSPRIDVQIPSTSEDDFAMRPTGRSGSNFIEDLPDQQFSSEEMWLRSRRPLEPDQMSFTSALTSIDVKRSVNDLSAAMDSPLQSPNGDVTPLSLDRGHNIPASLAQATKTSLDTQGKEVTASFKPPRSQDFTFRASDTSFLPTLPHKSLPPRASRQGSQPVAHDDVDRQSRSSYPQIRSPDSPAQASSKASAYLQEARKAAPSPSRGPTPKSNSSNTTSLSSPRSSALYGPNKPTTLSPPSSATTTMAAAAATLSSPLSSSSSNNNNKIGSASNILDKPIAKMLVECCHCRFYHDMPSRVYEAMARPDDLVKDKRLGVSGQVTMCVKCPWCAHNMSTVCCAGYAAVVYLKEKLHGP